MKTRLTNYNVRSGSGVGDSLGIIKGAHDQLDLGMSLLNLGASIFAAHKDGELPVWVCFFEGIQGVTTNEARGSCATLRQLRYFDWCLRYRLTQGPSSNTCCIM